MCYTSLFIGQAARANATVPFLKKRANFFPFQPIYPDSKDLKCDPLRRAGCNRGVSEGASEVSEQHKILSAAHRKGLGCLFKCSAHTTLTRVANKTRLLSNNPVSGAATVWGILLQNFGVTQMKTRRLLGIRGDSWSN